MKPQMTRDDSIRVIVPILSSIVTTLDFLIYNSLCTECHSFEEYEATFVNII